MELKLTTWELLKKKKLKIIKLTFYTQLRLQIFTIRILQKNMVDRIKNETNINNSSIRKLSKTKYRVLLGPFNDNKNIRKVI